MDLRCKRNCLFHGQADPALAGIDVNRATTTPLARGNKGIPFSHFYHAVYDWPRIQFRESWRRSGVQPMKNINRHVRSDCADAFGFWKIGNKENPAAGLG